MNQASHYDVILVGSGTANTMLARQLSAAGKRVLLLEKARRYELSETYGRLASMAKSNRVGKDISITSGEILGGSTAMYFAVCHVPDIKLFAQHGIDLSRELAETLAELPLTQLTADELPAQSQAFLEAAGALGFEPIFNTMLLDREQMTGGEYSYQAKWKALTLVDQAREQGAEIISEATVTGIVQENGVATGVEYQLRGQKTPVRVSGGQIVIGAGAFATPMLLRAAGLEDVGRQGFFCKPGCMVAGVVDGLQGSDGYVGCLDLKYEDGISLGDGTMQHQFFRLAMLANGKLRKAFQHRKVVSAGMLLDDELNGEVDDQGRYNKQLTSAEQQRFERARRDAHRIVEKAGGRDVFETSLVAALPGGAVRFGHHLDSNLQTAIRNLYVCDHSLMFDPTSTPTVALLALARRLARHLCSQPDAAAETPHSADAAEAAAQPE